MVTYSRCARGLRCIYFYFWEGVRNELRGTNVVMERCCRSTGTRTAHIWNDCREWSTPNVCTTVDHGNSVASWFGVPEPGGGRNIGERKSALHTNFWEDVKCYGACEGRNRGFGPLSTAIRSPFSQFWAEGSVPAKLPPKGPLSGRPSHFVWGLYKIIPTILFTFPATF